MKSPEPIVRCYRLHGVAAGAGGAWAVCPDGRFAVVPIVRRRAAGVNGGSTTESHLESETGKRADQIRHGRDPDGVDQLAKHAAVGFRLTEFPCHFFEVARSLDKLGVRGIAVDLHLSRIGPRHHAGRPGTGATSGCGHCDANSSACTRTDRSGNHHLRLKLTGVLAE